MHESTPITCSIVYFMHVCTHIMYAGKHITGTHASSLIMLFYGSLLRLIYSLINSLFLHMLWCIQQWRSCRSESDSTQDSKSIYVYTRVSQRKHLWHCNWSQALLFDFQKPSWPQNPLTPHSLQQYSECFTSNAMCTQHTLHHTSDHILSTIHLLSNVIISGFNRC